MTLARVVAAAAAAEAMVEGRGRPQKGGSMGAVKRAKCGVLSLSLSLLSHSAAHVVSDHGEGVGASGRAPDRGARAGGGTRGRGRRECAAHAHTAASPLCNSLRPQEAVCAVKQSCWRCVGAWSGRAKTRTAATRRVLPPPPKQAPAAPAAPDRSARAPMGACARGVTRGGGRQGGTARRSTHLRRKRPSRVISLCLRSPTPSLFPWPPHPTLRPSPPSLACP